MGAVASRECAARFELGVRDVFDVPKLHESRGPTVNIFQLLRT